MSIFARFFVMRAATERLSYIVVPPATCRLLSRVSAKVFALARGNVQLELNEHVEVLLCTNVRLSSEDHLKRPATAIFQSLRGDLNARLFIGDIWPVVVMQNGLSASDGSWFEPALSYLDEITLYLLDKEYKASLASLRKSGIAISLSCREIKSRLGMLGLVPHEPARYAVHLHFRLGNQLNVPASIRQLISFVEHNALLTLLLSGYQSISIVTWLLKLMAYLTGRMSINSRWMPFPTTEGFGISEIYEWTPQCIILRYSSPVRMPGIAFPLSETIQSGFRFTILLFLLDRCRDRRLYGALSCLDCLGRTSNLV
jgi:hypothetical protein